MSAEWYVNWFDSAYYHLLYNKRNDEEAERFIGHLCDHMDLPPGARAIDLACGRGRHSVALSKKGLDVTGLDLSANSISQASAWSGPHLRFAVHDMLDPFPGRDYAVIFNLFTSLGYFRNLEDNQRVFRNVADALSPGGRFVVDFFNAERIRTEYVPQTEEVRGEITFSIRKKIADNKIVKCISFADKGHDYYFEETVALLGLDDFTRFAANAGMITEEQFGDYDLREFDSAVSERLIMIFRK